MDAFLNIGVKIQAYSDRSLNSNPRLRAIDWTRESNGTIVSDPKTEAYTIDPSATESIFNGSRSTTIDGTSAFSIAVSTLSPDRYRITGISGTVPGFRTNRALTLNGIAVTFAVNSNNTVNVTLGSGSGFTAVQTGDIVFIPHTTTGDSANVLSVLNAGYWKVLSAVSTTNIQLMRLLGEDFSATAETVTLTADSQLQAFGGTGVMVGDTVDISSGFASDTRKAFEVVALSHNFVEIISALPLATEASVTPGAAGMIFYTNSKTFLYVEADQECVVRVNNDSSSAQKISPIEAGNTDKPGIYFRVGPTWSLSVVNRSSAPLNILLAHAE